MDTPRRSFLLSALAAATAGAQRSRRVGIIGHTGHGNYGHGIDTVWRSVPGMEVVAVADPDPRGRAAAVKRTRALREYADYREMLQREKLDLAGIGPRTLQEREPMIVAAANSKAHIFSEKPFAASPEQADRIVEAVQKNRVKLQLANQMRVYAYTLRAKAMIDAGEIGEIQEVRSRGKEDRRAGGEDLMVLGTHLFDMMRIFLGDPEWVTAHVTVDGRELQSKHVREATEPIGPVAGNQISAAFAFANGVHAHFASRAVADTAPLRFGTWIYGSKGVLFLPMAIFPEGALYVLRSPAWLPDDRIQWERVDVGVNASTEHANVRMVNDLLQAIERNTKPVCNEEDGRWTIEMVHGIYQAQRTGGRVRFPLQVRKHALAGVG